MTPDEYFNQHVPHRVNLLITFRERFSGNNKLNPESMRDFFRCSKDISLLMVRFFMDELGIVFKRERDNPNDDISQHWRPKFGITQLTEQEVKSDPRYSNLKIVLKAANRALAHIEPKYVNHPLVSDADHLILIDVINFTEENIKRKMYTATGRDFQKIMALPENDMNPKSIVAN